MSSYTDGIAKINKELLAQARALMKQNILTQAGLPNINTVAAGDSISTSPYANQLPGMVGGLNSGTLNNPLKRNNLMLKHGDIIVSEVANGMTVTVYRGEGALPDVYVATTETISDVIKLARVNNVLNRAK